jgi:hypothetical protein
MNIFRRKPELIQISTLEGRVTFLDSSEDVIRSAMRLVLSLAVEVEKAEDGMSLQRIEKINFNITGAKWEIKGGALSVSLYPEKPDSAIKLHAGGEHSSDLATALLYRDKLRGIVDSTIRRNQDWRVTWLPR